MLDPPTVDFGRVTFKITDVYGEEVAEHACPSLYLRTPYGGRDLRPFPSTSSAATAIADIDKSTSHGAMAAPAMAQET